MKRIIFLLFTSALCAEFTPVTSIDRSPEMEQSLDLETVYRESPVIYSSLALLALSCLGIAFYHLRTARQRDLLPQESEVIVHELLSQKNYTELLQFTKTHNSYFGKIITAGINARNYGPALMFESMKGEANRLGKAMWRKLAFLKEIALLAPLLGLLGTVWGLFYDGDLIGTTLVGLFVAIVAVAMHILLKHRLDALLSRVEQAAFNCAAHIQKDKA